MITHYDALRTAEEAGKRDSGHEEHCIRLGWVGFLPAPLDETVWVERVCGTRADGSQFIRFSRHNFGDCSGKEKSMAKTWVVEANTGKAAPQNHSACPLTPK